MGRLAVFIDGAYFMAIQRHEFDARLDVQKLVSEVRSHVERTSAEPIDLLRTYFYHCPPYQGDPPTQEEIDRHSNSRRFEDALRYLPRFEVRRGRLRMNGVDEWGDPVFEQKQVDLLLGLDMALLAGKGHVQHIALVAGDGDFVPALQVLKAEGVLVWLVHGPPHGRDGGSTYSYELFKTADERFELNHEVVERMRR